MTGMPPARMAGTRPARIQCRFLFHISSPGRSCAPRSRFTSAGWKSPGRRTSPRRAGDPRGEPPAVGDRRDGPRRGRAAGGPFHRAQRPFREQTPGLASPLVRRDPRVPRGRQGGHAAQDGRFARCGPTARRSRPAKKRRDVRRLRASARRGRCDRDLSGRGEHRGAPRPQAQDGDGADRPSGRVSKRVGSRRVDRSGGFELRKPKKDVDTRVRRFRRTDPRGPLSGGPQERPGGSGAVAERRTGESDRAFGGRHRTARVRGSC